MAAAIGCYRGPDDSDVAGETHGSTDAGSTSTDDGTSNESISGSLTLSSTDDTGITTQASTTGDDASTGDDTHGDDTTGSELDPEAAMVCERWVSDRADMDEGQWSGSVASCDPGDISATARANALRVMNLYRWLGGLPPVTTSDERNTKAQACALMMHANGQLSHSPPATWTCYSAEGAEGAGSSNISPTPGVRGVDLYMADPGNATTLGHRRWILSNSIGPTGLGSTTDYSCMWALGGSGNAGAAWMAFPPPGVVPFEAMTASWAPVDDTGWSLQSDTIDLAGANVEVIRDDGPTLPMVVHTLLPNFGSKYAISMIPNGWQTEPGHSYHVKVTGIAQPIEYDVRFVSCSP